LKSLIIRKYLVRICIYTMVFAALATAMDVIYNGVVINYLEQHLPIRLFWLIWHNKAATILIVYIAGLVVISGIYIFRLAHLLGRASMAVLQEEPLPADEKCPDELRDFASKLSQFKQLIKENEEARKAAEQQKNDLIVYLAHDLKTPLTSVIGYLSLLDEEPELPAQQRAKYTGIALDKAYRLETLINEFFEITRLNLQKTGSPKQQTNLTVLLLQVISEFYPMLESRNITLTQDIAPDLKIHADPAQLARVFENLLRNAVNYGEENGRLSCAACQNNGFAVVKISNSGETIPPEKLERIFDKFYRLDDARMSDTGGSGLGLAIAKQIVQQHAGTITVTSVDGITEFTVRLPM